MLLVRARSLFNFGFRVKSKISLKSGAFFARIHFRFLSCSRVCENAGGGFPKASALSRDAAANLT
jgi:hypothetical protein